MNKIIALLLFCLALFSCKEDTEYKTVYSAWGVVQLSETESLGYTVMLDDSILLIPNESSVDYVPSASDRMNISFTIADGYEIGDNPIGVDVEYVSYSTIKDLVVATDSLALDTLGNDPIGILDGSVRQSGYLMDVFFYLDYSGLKKHTVNLVYFPDSTATTDGGVYLEFRHNANNDNSSQTLQFLNCYDLTTIEPFQNVEDSVPYTIVVNGGYFSGAIARFEGFFYNPKYLD